METPRKLSKQEFSMFLGVFAPWAHIGFSSAELDRIEPVELSAMLRSYDRVLADKFDAWYAAVTALGAYVESRLDNSAEKF